MASNIALPFSESPDGKPILIVASSSPGTLVHEGDTLDAKDFIWLWLAIPQVIPVSTVVNVALVKGSPASGYAEDSIIYLKPGSKTLVEAGCILKGINLYCYLHGSSTDLTVKVTATGYVHRRVDG